MNPDELLEAFWTAVGEQVVGGRDRLYRTPGEPAAALDMILDARPVIAAIILASRDVEPL